MDASYYTDPACPWSWAAEPAVRALIAQFGAEVRFTYVMAGIARRLPPGPTVAAEWLEAAERSGMPVDVRLWLGEPAGAPASSHPACLAVLAGAGQGDPAILLRRLREGFLCRRRRLDGVPALVEEAGIAGLDVERFTRDLGSSATLERLASDLERVALLPTPEDGAARLPALELRGDDGEVHRLQGLQPPDAYAAAARAAGARALTPEPPDVEAALARFQTLSAAEVAAICRLPGPRAPAELWRLAAEWRVRAERLGTGELWSRA